MILKRDLMTCSRSRHLPHGQRTLCMRARRVEGGSILQRRTTREQKSPMILKKGLMSMLQRRTTTERT